MNGFQLFKFFSLAGFLAPPQYLHEEHVNTGTPSPGAWEGAIESSRNKIRQISIPRVFILRIEGLHV